MNFPIFCNTKEKRQLLRLVSDVYLHTEGSDESRKEFECIRRNATDAIYAKVEENKTIIAVANIKVPNKEIKAAADKVLRRANDDESQFFIAKY